MKGLSSSLGGNTQESISPVRHQSAQIMQKPRPRLGQLLLDAGLITSLQLHEALIHSLKLQRQIGQSLVDMGFVGESDITAALAIQQSILSGETDEQRGVLALRHANVRGVHISVAMKELDAMASCLYEDFGLGELLVESSVLRYDSYRQSLMQMHEDGGSLVRMLLATGLLSLTTLDAALIALSLVRDNSLTKTQARGLLREIHRDGKDMKEAAQVLRIRLPFAPAHVHLGTLLMRAGLINEIQKLEAMERSLSERKMLGEILIAAKNINALVLEQALLLQKYVSEALISLEDAIRLLPSAHKMNVDIFSEAVNMLIISTAGAGAGLEQPDQQAGYAGLVYKPQIECDPVRPGFFWWPTIAVALFVLLFLSPSHLAVLFGMEILLFLSLLVKTVFAVRRHFIRKRAALELAKSAAQATKFRLQKHGRTAI